jgi:hypothetical protein
MREFAGICPTYVHEWDLLLGGHDPYKVTQELSASANWVTFLEHSGNTYSFQYKGQAFSPNSTLLVENKDGVCREYRKGWELEVVSRAIEDIVRGWHKPTAYPRDIYSEPHYD